MSVCGQCVVCMYRLGLLNTPWSSLPTMVRKALLQRTIEMASTSNAQSLTNILYGLCLMQAPLPIFPPSFKDAIHTQIVALFTQRKHFSPANKQSLSNVLYSLANTGYQWPDLPASTRAALLQGINTYAEYFIPQELSVTVSSYVNLPLVAVHCVLNCHNVLCSVCLCVWVQCVCLCVDWACCVHRLIRPFP